MIRKNLIPGPGPSTPYFCASWFQVALRLGVVLICASVALLAQASGFVTNKSTNQPQPGVKVTLSQLSESGVTTPVSTSTSDAQGRFSFADSLTGIYALVSEYQGVKYTQVIPPMLPKDNLQVSVYDTTNSPSAITVDQHIYFLEPGPSQLVVSETYVLLNNTQRAYRNTERGSVRFYLPPEAKGVVQAAVIGPDQRPSPSVAQKTSEADVYQVNDAIPPGESRVDLNYLLPYEGGSGAFRTRNRYENTKTRIVVAPGVQVSGDGLQSMGPEPRTQAQIFDFKGNDVAVQLTGSGSIAEVNGGAEGGESDTPQIQTSPAPIYDNFKMIVAAGAAAMIFAFLLLYRRSAFPSGPGDSGSGGTRAG